MAIIGKIRSRLGGLLVVLVGGALLLFVISGLLDPSSNGGLFSRGSRSVGTIAGEEVDIQEFERLVSDEVEALRNDFGQNVDDQSQRQIRDAVWNEIIKRRVLKDQLEEAGFGSTLSKEEYDDIRFGNNMLPEFRNQPNFQDPATGQADPEKVRQYFVMIEQRSPTTAQRRGYYDIQKVRLVENRLYTKYNTLVKNSTFANSAQARDEFEQKNLKATFNFVVKPFSGEPDSLYQPDENDLVKYYNAHKNDRKYRQKASRSFDFVTFAVTPTEEDKANAFQELAALKDDFQAAVDDSLFVVGNSESRSYTVFPYQGGSADAATDSLITHADTGMVIGPYQEGELLKLVKVKELAEVPEARVRHILLKSSAEDDAEKKARADSLLAVVKRDRDRFEELVTRFSDDPGSKSNGGVYEWFDKNRMVPEFTKASFDEKVGAITVAKTSYGYHVVEVLGQRTRQERRVVSVDLRVKPSPATSAAVYKKANEFSLDHNTVETFKSGADTLGLEVKPVDDMRLDQRYIPGLTEPAAVASWVNNAEPGSVSKPLTSGESYVVALLKKVKEEGAPDLDDVRETFTREVVKEKKAAAYIGQMEGKTDLNALAAELGLGVQTATDMAYNTSSLPGGYTEMEVVGRIFALQNGATSAPLKGENGVYVATMTTLTPAPEISDVATERKALTDRLQGRAETTLINALNEAAGVVDERGKYY